MEAGQPFERFKSMQREQWAGFAVNEQFTTIAAGRLVAFAKIAAGERVLDVACGTGVVALSAARAGALASGLDLTPALLARAREHATLAGCAIDFVEGDAEALPYADASFDVVVSQFGHIFAPRPEVVTAEMLRVLRPGGRIAFTTWPPEHMMGRLFALIGGAQPPLAAGETAPAPPWLWGDPAIVRERLGDRVTGLRFGRTSVESAALSARHVVLGFEANVGPLAALLARLDAQSPRRAAEVRAGLLSAVEDHLEESFLRQHMLMTVATKGSITDAVVFRNTLP